MSATLVVERRGERLLAARMVDGVLVEVLVEADDPGRVADRLFAARVTRVDTKIQAAFLDLGLREPGFLNVKDARHLPTAGTSSAIDRIVHEGQRLIVQGTRDPGGGKGSRVTADIRLVGLYLVHRPYSEVVEASGNLGKRQQALLVERGQALFPQGGYLLRRGADQADDAALRHEAARLGARWTELQRRLAKVKPGPLPVDGDSVLERLLRTVLGGQPVTAIVAADADLVAGARAFVAELGERAPLVDVLGGTDTPFEATGVAEQIATALGREVPLKGGGRLLIEPTAALVAIDVDGGGRDALQTDLEAAAEIARQLRLRNLGGIVVVDFVGLPGRHERARVTAALRRALADDPLPCHVHDTSPLGLVEIGRARRGAPLAALLDGEAA